MTPGKDIAAVRHYAPSPIRRLVALERESTPFDTGSANNAQEASMMTHSRLLMTGSVLFLALSAGITVTSAQEQKTPLDGVWRTVEVVVPGEHSQTFKPQSTLAIFHGRHYSRVEVHAEHPRTPLADPARASADELRAVWGPFVGEAGTFKVSGNEITMQATVAKNPAAMKDGAVSVYTYRIDGDALTLTQVRTHAGPSAPVTIKATRVE
jgi:hypothetical protein